MQGLGVRIQDSGFRDLGLGCRAQCVQHNYWDFGLSLYKFRDEGLGSRALPAKSHHMVR